MTGEPITLNGQPEIVQDGRTDAERIADLEQRVERIETALASAEEQGRAAMAKMPRAMRKMLGIPDPDDAGGD